MGEPSQCDQTSGPGFEQTEATASQGFRRQKYPFFFFIIVFFPEMLSRSFESVENAVGFGQLK